VFTSVCRDLRLSFSVFDSLSCIYALEIFNVVLGWGFFYFLRISETRNIVNFVVDLVVRLVRSCYDLGPFGMFCFFYRYFYCDYFWAVSVSGAFTLFTRSVNWVSISCGIGAIPGKRPVRS
jgi:hypothetical protein